MEMYIYPSTILQILSMVGNYLFVFSFTQETNIKGWIAVGFMPMTGNAVNDPNVSHKLGAIGAPQQSLT